MAQSHLGDEGVSIAVQLEDSHEGLGGNLYGPQVPHLLLAFLLLFQQLLFTGDIAAVALGQHVLTHGLHRFTGDDAPADGRLNGYFEQLARDILLQLFAQPPGAGIGLIPVGDEAEGVHAVSPFRSRSTFTRSLVR